MSVPTTTHLALVEEDVSTESWRDQIYDDPAGVDDADLAAIAGHTVLTMVTHYTHAPGKSFDPVRGVIG